MRIGVALAMLAPLLAGLDAGCSDPCGTPNNITAVAAGVAFRLSCSPNDLTNVEVTGPCARNPPDGGFRVYDPDAGLQWYTGAATELFVSVFASAPGVCHIELIFATGFTYSQDVTFDWQGTCGQHYIGPTSGPFTVDNPSDTCVALDSGAAE